MLSLHHITHAVCVVIICFLIKKNIELRVQHNDLRYRYEGLVVTCRSTQRQNGDAECNCAEQSKAVFTQPSTTGSGPMELTKGGQSAVSTEKGLFTSQSGPFEVEVDEFGKTLDYDAEGNSHPQFSGSSGASPEVSALPKLPPLDQNVQPSFTFTMASKESEVLNARHGVDGRTDVSEISGAAAASLDSTKESLEAVKPSSTSQGDEAETVGNSHTDFSTLETAQNDFYLGSQVDEKVAKDQQHIFATGSFSDAGNREDFLEAGMQETPFIPDSSFDEVHEEYWEEYEEEDEDEMRPCLVRLPQKQLSDTEQDKVIDKGTSVHCSGRTVSDRTCRFQNLCFDRISGNFLVLKSKNSIFLNVPSLKENDALLELSTVAGHNAQFFTYITVTSDHIKDTQVAVVPGTTIIFKRFKPDNIMHVFHDDIIPLFHTLHSENVRPRITKDWDGKFPLSVFLADENSEGEFWDLYDMFAGNGIFTRESVAGIEANYLCFPEAYVGLSKETTWYQYGFFSPQGPIPDYEVTSYQIHSVSSYLLNHFARDCMMCGTGGHLVLILRKETRLILNEMELVMAINKEFRLKVMTVSLETHDLSDMIPIIHSSRGIIGMHGSLLSLAMFLRQGSIVVELFPYAVNSSKYTPYKTLCEIPGVGVAYRAWTNNNPENTVPHPDWSPELGGIRHLPVSQQEEIAAQTEVPSHLCCEDPSWLYHIFQDTVVSIPEALDLIKSALEEGRTLWSENGKPIVAKSKTIPGPVKNLKCQSEHTGGKHNFIIQWEPPWNMSFDRHNIKYTIHLQDSHTGRGLHFNSGQQTVFKVSEGIKPGVEYRVWVRCVQDGTQGPFANMVTCHT